MKEREMLRERERERAEAGMKDTGGSGAAAVSSKIG
jgi:hypothetical protein